MHLRNDSADCDQMWCLFSRHVFFIRFNSVSESFDSAQPMSHNGFTRLDSGQVMTQKSFLKIDSNRLTTQKSFQNLDSNQLDSMMLLIPSFVFFAFLRMAFFGSQLYC